MQTSAQDEQQQDDTPNPHDEPCKQPLSPELGNGIEIPVTVVFVTQSGQTFTPVLMYGLIAKTSNETQPLYARPPPEPVALQVVRVKFLRI